MADSAAGALGAGHEVTLVRTFNAPAALVFDCFTDADRLRGFLASLTSPAAR